MKKNWMMAAVLAGASAFAMAQTAPDSTPAGTPTAQQPANSMGTPQADTSAAAQPKKGPAIPVTLDKSIDSKKAKSGDQIEAKTSVPLNGANLSIPAGSKVIGHITDAKAKSKGDPQSSLSFEFDKIVVKKGQEIPFHAIAQAIGAPVSGANVAYPNTAEQGGAEPPSAAAGSSAGHTASAGGGGAPAASSRPSEMGGMGDNPGASAGASGQLGSDATGVVGLKNLNLTSQANSSVISSDSKSVKLDGGTQMMLRVLSQ